MPKLQKGIYEKYGYPKAIKVGGDSYDYATSGQTRMLYVSNTHSDRVAKVMPASISAHYQPGWVQNQTEAETLKTLSSLSFFPKVHAHEDIAFTNTYGVQDTMNVLIVDLLGMDLN